MSMTKIGHNIRRSSPSHQTCKRAELRLGSLQGWSPWQLWVLERSNRICRISIVEEPIWLGWAVLIIDCSTGWVKHRQISNHNSRRVLIIFRDRWTQATDCEMPAETSWVLVMQKIQTNSIKPRSWWRPNRCNWHLHPSTVPNKLRDSNRQCSRYLAWIKELTLQRSIRISIRSVELNLNKKGSLDWWIKALCTRKVPRRYQKKIPQKCRKIPEKSEGCRSCSY